MAVIRPRSLAAPTSPRRACAGPQQGADPVHTRGSRALSRAGLKALSFDRRSTSIPTQMSAGFPADVSGSSRLDVQRRSADAADLRRPPQRDDPDPPGWSLGRPQPGVREALSFDRRSTTAQHGGDLSRPSRHSLKTPGRYATWRSRHCFIGSSSFCASSIRRRLSSRNDAFASTSVRWLVRVAVPRFRRQGANETFRRTPSRRVVLAESCATRAMRRAGADCFAR